jgi:hypothetical protein
MPSHKALKGIVHSFVLSFTSTLIYFEHDYVMGHIVTAALRTGATELKANILTGHIESSPLSTYWVKESIKSYVRRFNNIVILSNSSLEFIRSADFTITVDPTIKRLNIYTHSPEFPFTCTLRIIDDRDKIYSYTLKDWWIPEEPY